jgi:hypothetical protein
MCFRNLRRIEGIDGFDQKVTAEASFLVYVLCHPSPMQRSDRATLMPHGLGSQAFSL